jgi:hypothetical protein
MAEAHLSLRNVRTQFKCCISLKDQTWEEDDDDDDDDE